MVKSKTKISKQLERKRNPEIIHTIIAAKKFPAWVWVADLLSRPRSKYKNINLGDIDKKLVQNKTLVVVGKILSEGEITKKGRIACLNFSSKAKEKLLSAGVDVVSILEEVKKNPDGKNIEVLKWQ